MVSRKLEIGHEADAFIEEFLDSLDWDGQIGQMAQIDINMLLDDEKTGLRQDLLDHYIGTLGVGSVLNNHNELDPLWKMDDYRRAVLQIQETARKYDRPPVIWGLDSVHGANYIYDTITTPQPINLAASFNTSLAYQAGLIASRDTRRAGIPWLFSPLLGLSWNPFWSRVYETFGEDPELVGEMALAMTKGIQAAGQESDSESAFYPSRAAASGKHFVGYSNPHNGHDRAPSWIPKRHLYQYFVPPWKKVANEIDTIMESYTEVDGVPNVANRQTLVKLLRKELGFKGMLVTDYHEIFNLLEWHHTAKDHTDALQQSLMEGSVDMSMIANEPDDFFEAFKPMKFQSQWKNRVRKSARRVLELKYKLNMFQESFDMKMDPVEGPGHSQQDLDMALDMTEQSIVLAKNDQNILPLNTGKELRVLITGPTAKSQSFTSGGWTAEWQGVDDEHSESWFTYGSTVVDAIQKEANWKVSYVCGVDILGRACEPEDDFVSIHDSHNAGEVVVDTFKDLIGWEHGQAKESIERAVHLVDGHDVVVVCLGEENYTEKPGDIRDLNLPSGQYELVSALRAASDNVKIVLAYFGGRPRILRKVEPLVDAIFLAFLPGPLAGEALVNLISGRANPSARLPISYPKYEDGSGIPYLHAVSDMCTEDTGDILPHWNNIPCDTQWPFGHGLSYSNFAFEDLSISTTTLMYRLGEVAPSVTVSFTVRNEGGTGGAFPAMIFTFDNFRETTPEYKRLRGFEKYWVGPKESKDVSFDISLDDLRFIGNHDESHYVLQDGIEFRVGIGPETDCRVNPDDTRCSPNIVVKLEENYVGACEAACNVWSVSSCAQQAGMKTSDCWEACSSIHQDESTSMNNDGWGWNYVSCVESIIWDDDFMKEQDCWKLTKLCRNIFETPSIDEYGKGLKSAGLYGSQSQAFSKQDDTSALVLLLALFTGVLASAMVVFAMRGGLKRKRRDGIVEFTPIHTEELMT